MKNSIVSIVSFIFLFFSYISSAQENNEPAPNQKDKLPILNISATLYSDKQVSDITFSKLIFKDLNYLILGDDSPQQGISYEYKEDLSSLKLSGYVADFNWNGKKNGFVTIDGEFKTKNGIYFFDKEKGGSQAKVTGNIFFTIDSYRSYKSLFSEKNGQSEWNKARQQAYIRTNYQKVQLLQDLYTKYKTLFSIASKINYPVESLSIKDTIRKNAEPYLEDHKIEFEFLEDAEFDLSKYKVNSTIESIIEFQNINKLKGEEKRKLKKVADGNNENFEGYKIDKEEVTLIGSTYNLSKVFAELKDVKNKIDSLAFALEKIEIEEAEEIWTSKHVWYMGVSPFYARESLEIFNFNENLETSDQFKTQKKDIVGLNINLNYFTQNKKESFNRFYARANLEISKSSNFNDLSLSQIKVIDSFGIGADGNLLEVVSEKNAYNGSLVYSDAFKVGASLEGYLWVLNDFGIFSKIGINNYNYSSEIIKDKSEIPFRLGVLYEFKNSKESGKVAVIQAFLDRNDLKNHPQAKDQNLRFGFKVGIPINIKSKL
ncbi:hypothetical protein [Gramella sp. AN32]|uniref:Uncharacterized protein n=1 Tax=Christiangramia antarctica TaxID=2058158 RepID=A0ABW5XAL7_9FLAO|nr:hypothetical protein [Gramella sp. AN32]MCM4155982.1 hypothetical protein [Gramella sp. AN32]